MCDLDLLEKNPDIREYLSEYCQSLIGDANALEEAILFGTFFDKLNDLEIKHDSGFDPSTSDAGIPVKMWDLRKTLHQRYDYFDCVKSSTNANDFHVCLAERRRQMIAMIPNN